MVSMQPEKEPEELIAARTKLNSASLTQQENEPAGKHIQQSEYCLVALLQCVFRLCIWHGSLTCFCI